jgi:cytochrome c-type biogenesis protein CcmH
MGFAEPSLAVRPDEMLSDPALEVRAEAISRNIRCVVCQGENIEDSNADIAHDLRVIVRERLKAGATEEQVFDYLVARYGDFVLLKPPLEAKTILIWTGPFLLLLCAGFGVYLYCRHAERREAQPLCAAEEARLESILKTHENGPKTERGEGHAA